MVVSITPLSVRHGSHYYAREGHHAEGDQHNSSRWYGKLAAKLELEGPVTPGPLIHLLQGRSPMGEVLVQKPKQEGGTTERAGVDLTTSAPKSVSLQALILGDRRLEDSHRQATERMLDFLEERYAFTRQMHQGQRTRVLTGQLIIAQFHHDTSRELDPQLHTHNLILNLQQLANGQWRSLDNEALYRTKMLLGLVYRNELAREVQRLGYDLQITRTDRGLWELKGFSSEQLTQFSKRSQQIQEQAGAEASSQHKAWIAISSGRKKKQEISRADMESHWQQEADAIDLLPLIPEPEREIVGDPEAIAFRLQPAIDLLAAQKTVFRREELERLTLLSVGQMDVTHLQQAIDQHPHLTIHTNHRGQQLCTYQPEVNQDFPDHAQHCIHRDAETHSPGGVSPDPYQLPPTPQWDLRPLYQFRQRLQALTNQYCRVPAPGKRLAGVEQTNSCNDRADGTASAMAQTAASGSDSDSATPRNSATGDRLSEFGGAEPDEPLSGNTPDSFPNSQQSSQSEAGAALDLEPDRH